MFVEFGGKQLKSHMLSTNVEQAAKAVKVLNCIFGEGEIALRELPPALASITKAV